MKLNNDILVSVIIPCYNRASTIERAAASVLSQNYSNVELIIVDDCSNDNTCEIIKKINDGRIKYFRHERNMGPSAARNTGIKNSAGRFIAFQDSDDEWLPEKLKLQVECLKSLPENYGAVYCGFYKIKNNSKFYVPAESNQKKDGDIYESLLTDNFIGPPAMLIKKVCFDRAGMFNENLRRIEDWELCLRIAKFYHFKFINKPLVNSYYSDGGVNETGIVYFTDALEVIINKNIDALKKHPEILSFHYYKLLCNYQLLKIYDRAFDSGLKSLYNSFKLKTILRLFYILLCRLRQYFLKK